MLKQQLIELAADLAETMQLAAPTFNEEGFGVLHCPDGVDLHLQYLPADESCLMFVILGQLPQLNRENIIEYAMTANLFWRRTCGATLAYEKEFHSMVLQDRLPLLELDLGLLHETVGNLLETVALWTGLIQKSHRLAEEGGVEQTSQPIDPAHLMARFDPRRLA